MEVMQTIHFTHRADFGTLGSVMQIPENQMLDEYRKHVAERAEQGIVPLPLDAEQVEGLIALL